MTASSTPIHDWLTGAISAGRQAGCPACMSIGSTCPSHAADAVLDACRTEKLFILDRAAADATLNSAGLLWSDNRGPASQDMPPRAGDVWRDDALHVTWFARPDADGDVELVDTSGIALPAAQVRQIRGGMRLVSRTAGSAAEAASADSEVSGDLPTAMPQRGGSAESMLEQLQHAQPETGGYVHQPGDW